MNPNGIKSVNVTDDRVDDAVGLTQTVGSTVTWRFRWLDAGKKSPATRPLRTAPTMAFRSIVMTVFLVLRTKGADIGSDQGAELDITNGAVPLPVTRPRCLAVEGIGLTGLLILRSRGSVN